MTLRKDGLTIVVIKLKKKLSKKEEGEQQLIKGHYYIEHAKIVYIYATDNLQC